MKDLHYFNFKGHLLIEQGGLIVDCAVAAVNIDEREMIFKLDRQGISTISGDKGYIYNENMKEDFKDIGLTVHTPLRENMKDDRAKQRVQKLSRKRGLIETVIGQLCERFRIEKNQSQRFMASDDKNYSQIVVSRCKLLFQQQRRQFSFTIWNNNAVKNLYTA